MYIYFSNILWLFQVISGIESAVRSMRVGGIRRVIIPPSEGYQNTMQEPIPPNVCISFKYTSFYCFLILISPFPLPQQQEKKKKERLNTECPISKKCLKLLFCFWNYLMHLKVILQSTTFSQHKECSCKQNFLWHVHLSILLKIVTQIFLLTSFEKKKK